MSLITVAGGQPIRSTHISQFTRWITAVTKDQSASFTTTHATEYTVTVTNEETSVGNAFKVVSGASTIALFNKTGATLNVPLFASNPLASIFSSAGQLVYGSGGTAAATLAGGTRAQYLRMSAGGIPNWETVSPLRVTDYGAVGNATTDDTAALQAAITAAALASAVLYVPPGTYRHTGLTIPGNLVVVGAGRAAATLLLASSASTTTDNVVITAQTGAQVNWGGLFDISITPQSASQGRHAVNFDLNADNRQVVQYTIERCYLAASTSVAAARALVNTPDATPVNTTFALNRFIGNRFFGGVQFLSVQDSLTFDDNYFAGPNVGLEISTTGGAGNIRITRNNMVSDGGGIWLKTVAGNAVSGVVIAWNYLEKLSAWAGGSGNTAMIDLDATNADEIIAPIVMGNQVSILTGYGGAGKSCIRIKNVAKAVVTDNNLHPIDASTVGVLQTSGAADTYIGAGNKMGAGSGTLASIVSDTTGVDETGVRGGVVTLALNATFSLGAMAASVGTILIFSTATADAAFGILHNGANTVGSIYATNFGGAGTGFTLGSDAGTGFSVYHDGTVYRIKNRNAATRTIRYRIQQLTA